MDFCEFNQINRDSHQFPVQRRSLYKKEVRSIKYYMATTDPVCLGMSIAESRTEIRSFSLYLSFSRLYLSAEAY